MPVVRLSVLTERKTESIGFPMTMSTSLSSPNGMLKVTADRGRLQDDDGGMDRWMSCARRYGKAETTEAKVRRF